MFWTFRLSLSALSCRRYKTSPADFLSCLIFLGGYLFSELGAMVVAEQIDSQLPFSFDCFSSQTWVLPKANILIWPSAFSLFRIVVGV